VKPAIEGVLIDFDGVICPNAVNLTFDFVYQFVNRYIKIPRIFIENYLKVISCFPVDLSAKLLFTSLGLEDKIDVFKTDFRDYDKKVDTLEIDPDFLRFMQFCEKNSIMYRIFSLANKERIEKITNINPEFIYPFGSKGKANIQTYQDLEKQLNTSLSRWIYIDDHPLALHTGKKAGLTTAMMLNTIFSEDDYNSYRDTIDYKINNFKELHKIFEFQLQKNKKS